MSEVPQQNIASSPFCVSFLLYKAFPFTVKQEARSSAKRKNGQSGVRVLRAEKGIKLSPIGVEM